MPLVRTDAADVDVSLVMVNHNHGAEAIRAITSLVGLADRARFELVFVDNACSDGVAHWLATQVPAARVIKNAKIKGFAANCNEGIRAAAADSRYVALLNPDTECLPGVLDELVGHMDACQDVGIVGPCLLNPDGSRQASVRRFITPHAMVVRALHLDRVAPNLKSVREYLMSDRDHAQGADVDWVTGAFLMARRRAVAEIGLMDERYFLYAEDQDWCCRMWRGGWRVRYVPSARAIHTYQQEGYRKPWSRSARRQLVSAVLLFWKFNWRLSRTSPDSGK
jgi:GT2 family glycosyltransferase